MIIKKYYNSILVILFAFLLSACGPNSQFGKKYNKPFKHNTPLIKDQNIVESGKSEVAKTLEMGPKPLEGDSRKLGKRKKISSEAQRNYLIISDEYPLLKQRVTLKFKKHEIKDIISIFVSSKIGIFDKLKFFYSVIKSNFWYWGLR
mgnify:CR=1 FL=1